MTHQPCAIHVVINAANNTTIISVAQHSAYYFSRPSAARELSFRYGKNDVDVDKIKLTNKHSLQLGDPTNMWNTTLQANEYLLDNHATSTRN